MASLNKKNTIRVLHVDDELCFLEVSEQILSTENNFEIDNAASVDEALKKMGQQSYDAVVSDYEMPQKNGLEFLKELREQNNQIPFILFTGKGREDIAVKALNLGADSYLNKNGSPETVYCELAHAINKTVEQKKSAELLAASESKYRTLVEKSLQGILVTLAAPLRLVFANDSMGKSLGYSSHELLSLTPEGIMGLVHHEDRAVFFKRVESRLQGEQPGSFHEFRAVRKDGSVIWMNALANLIEFEGQPAVQGVFLDINERKKAEEALRRSEEKHRQLVEHLQEGIWSIDKDSFTTFVNSRMAEILGYTVDEMLGKPLFEFMDERGIEIAKRLLERRAQGIKEQHDFEFVKKDGGRIYATLETSPINDSNGNYIGALAGVMDITERRKAEADLRESEERFRAIFEGASDGIIAADVKLKRFVIANLAMCELTGYSLKELLMLGVDDIHPKEDLPYVFGEFMKQTEGKTVLASDIPVLRKDGQVVYCDVNSKVSRFGKAEYLVGFFRDITERKKAEVIQRQNMVLKDTDKSHISQTKLGREIK